MADAELQTGVPPLSLVGGTVLTFEARDPATGALVSGVTVSSVVIYGDGEGGSFVDAALPLYLLPGGN